MNYDIQFQSAPVLRFFPASGVKAALAEPFLFTIDGVPFTLETNMPTDGSSQPRSALLMSGFDGRCLRAALPHDKGYQTRGHIIDANGEMHVFTREQLDHILRCGMKTCGASTFEQDEFFLGVRAGGWVAWNAKPLLLGRSDPENTEAIKDAEAVNRVILQSRGITRSPHWPELVEEIKAEQKVCQYCGTNKNLQAHHIHPFHLFPKEELVRSNILMLCMSLGEECHFVQGHKRNWMSYEPNIREICEARRLQKQLS